MFLTPNKDFRSEDRYEIPRPMFASFYSVKMDFKKWLNLRYRAIISIGLGYLRNELYPRNTKATLFGKSNQIQPWIQ